VFSLLAAIFGWLVTSIASRKDIGVGSEELGYLITATALHIIAMCISGGFHQALSKFVSEALVDSKEQALRYARAAFIIFTLIGTLFFTIFLGISFYFFPRNPAYGLVFGIMAFAYFFTFFKDNFMGNLAAIHRFDYIGLTYFISGVCGPAMGLAILFLVPEPLNAQLLPLIIITNLVVATITLLHFMRKIMPYPPSAVLRGARRKEMSALLKYGAYCIIPNIIFSAAILWIQNLYYAGFFGFDSTIVSANGLIVGYAGIVFAINNFGWAQIPAVSEAKAQNNYEMIDEYMKSTLHTGFNLTAFFLVIYVGLSHVLLNFVHGSEYLIAHIPFIVLTIAVAILGVEFLICTLLMGLGEGKKAAFLILFLTLIQVILVPILILILKGVPLASGPLYAGPISLLISAISIFPLAFHYLKNNTKAPTRVYTGILGKAAISIICTLLIYGLLELIVFPHNNLVVGLIVRAAILFGLFSLFMLVFAGYNDKDLDMFEGIKLFSPIVQGMRWLLHHSPFYAENGTTEKKDTIERRDANGI
jgi:O-antigen/teichoic acid export membrane protein